MTTSNLNAHFSEWKESFIKYDTLINKNKIQSVIVPAVSGLAAIALLALGLFVLMSHQSHSIAILLPSAALGIITLGIAAESGYNVFKRNQFIKKLANEIIKQSGITESFKQELDAEFPSKKKDYLQLIISSMSTENQKRFNSLVHS